MIPVAINQVYTSQYIFASVYIFAANVLKYIHWKNFQNETSAWVYFRKADHGNIFIRMYFPCAPGAILTYFQRNPVVHYQSGYVWIYMQCYLPVRVKCVWRYLSIESVFSRKFKYDHFPRYIIFFTIPWVMPINFHCTPEWNVYRWPRLHFTWE